MDESWRCTMGSVLPRQRSSDGQNAAAAAGHQSLAPDDFRDVFGGPPRTVLLSSFYGEAADCHSATGHSGQHPYSYGGAADAFGRRPYVDGRGKLASAAVPTEEGFFDDIFGTRHMRWRSSRSKSTKSSSAVSSEEFGPAFCRSGRGDATLSSFASKLRPIAIPSRRYDSSPPSTMSTIGEQSSFTCSTAAYPACRYYYGGGGGDCGGFKTARRTDHSSAASSNAAAEGSAARHHRASSSGFCCFTSNPETTSHEPSFRRTRRGRARPPSDTATECSRADDYGYYYSPPSSAASSSLFGNPLPRTPRRLEDAVMMEVRERAPLLMDDGDVDSVGAAAVDEAITWAKERFWSQAQ